MCDGMVAAICVRTIAYARLGTQTEPWNYLACLRERSTRTRRYFRKEEANRRCESVSPFSSSDDLDADGTCQQPLTLCAVALRLLDVRHVDPLGGHHRSVLR